MKYEVRLRVIPDDLSVTVIPAFYYLDLEHFDKIADSCQAHQIPVGVADPETVSETPAPVFEPEPTVADLPEAVETPETAQEPTNEG